MQQVATPFSILTSLARGDDPGVDYTQAYDALIRGGDCSLDAFQGVYWSSKNRRLIESPTVNEVRLECPVIVCGSGPSLDRAFDRLRALNGIIPIFAAESAASILVDNDIHPDFVCPLERVDDRVDYMRGAYDACYCGVIFCPTKKIEKFKRSVIIANNTWINEWMDLGPISGSTINSGATAAITAATISNREVFLVGMDGCAGHCKSYLDPSIDNDMYLDVLCYDGKKRPSKDEWRVTTDNLGYALSKRGGVFQTDASTAVIQNVELGGLPDPAKVPQFDTSIKVIHPHNRSVEKFAAYASTFRDDFERAYNVARSWTCAEDMNTEDLCDNRNGWAISYVMSTVIRQMTIERALGRGDMVCDWFCTAMKNIIDNLWNMMGEIQNAH